MDAFSPEQEARLKEIESKLLAEIHSIRAEVVALHGHHQELKSSLKHHHPQPERGHTHDSRAVTFDSVVVEQVVGNQSDVPGGAAGTLHMDRDVKHDVSPKEMKRELSPVDMKQDPTLVEMRRGVSPVGPDELRRGVSPSEPGGHSLAISEVRSRQASRRMISATERTGRSNFDYHDLWAEDEVRLPQESIWDAALYVGIGAMAWADSIFICLLFLANLFLQMLLAQMISEMARRPEGMLTEPGLEGILHWRLSVGHHARTYDETTGSNLITRVCGEYIGLITAERQASSENAFGEYLQFRLKNSGIPPLAIMEAAGMKLGEFLCMSVLFIWLITMCNELREILKTALAWTSIPRARESALRRDPNDGTISFRTIGYGRLMAMWLCVIVPRFVVAIVLLFMGSSFLVNTPSVSDLILNAVALAFVFDIDELFFKVTPPVCQRLLTESQALPVARILGKKNVPGLQRKLVGIVEMIFVMLAVVLLLVYYFGDLQDVVSGVDEAMKLMCGGDLTFTYTTNRATGQVFHTGTSSISDITWPRDLFTVDGPYNRTELSLTMSAALQLSGLYSLGLPTIKNLPPEVTHDRYSAMSAETSARVVSEMYREGLYEAIERLECEDHDRDRAERYALYSSVALQLLPDNDLPEWPNTTSCAHVLHFCHRPEVQRRCPMTCRCTQPFEGKFFLDGCPPSCGSVLQRKLLDLEAGLQGLNAEGCVDAPLSSTGTDTSVAHPGLNERWWERFFGELQERMAAEGFLEKVPHVQSWPLTAKLNAAVQSRTGGRYHFVDGATMDFVGMARAFAISYDSSPCLVEWMLRTVFDLDLCSWNDFTVGNLAALCPVQCGVCQVISVDGIAAPLAAEARFWSWHEILNMQVRYNWAYIEEAQPSMHELQCGTTARADTRVLPHYGFLPGPDAIFTFEVTSSSLYYTLDLCSEGTKIDTVMRVLRGPWKQAMEMYPDLILGEDDNSCGSAGQASSLMLTGLEPGTYLAWIDDTAIGGQIEVSYRCTDQPLYWEVVSGAENCSIEAQPGNRSCLRASNTGGNDLGCNIRVFPPAWREQSMVLYPQGYFDIGLGELLVTTGGGVNGPTLLRNTGLIFESIGTMPIDHIEWRPQGFADWEICTMPFARQPWDVTGSSPRTFSPLQMCRRAYVNNSDCISNNNFARDFWYEPGGSCTFEVLADWKTLPGASQGIQVNQFEIRDLDAMTLDQGTNTSRSFSGHVRTGLGGAIAEHNLVWSSDISNENIFSSAGWTLCLDVL